jgi:hypothetical protein
MVGEEKAPLKLQTLHLFHRLIAAPFPEWASLPIEPALLMAAGHDANQREVERAWTVIAALLGEYQTTF